MCEPWNAGIDVLRLRVMLLGPPGLDHVDDLTVVIRDDQFRRVDFARDYGRTPEEVALQIWGPYRFRPGTGPDHARAEETGRTTVYDHPLPVGEELIFVLEPTTPPPWAQGLTQDGWQSLQHRTIRLSLRSARVGYEPWTLPCEVEVGEGTDTVVVLVPAP